MLPRRPVAALPYRAVAASWLTTAKGACILGYRVTQPLRQLPRLPIDLFTLYHLRYQSRFPPPPRHGSPAVTQYLTAYHEAPHTALADEVILTVRTTAHDAQLVAAQYRHPALELLTGTALASFLRRTTTFRDESPRFDGVASLSEAILPYEVYARLGALTTSDDYPHRIAMVLATEPPATTHPGYLDTLLSYPGPLLCTAHFAPEPITVTAAAARRSLRHQRAGGGDALASDDANALTRELYAGNRRAGLLSVTVAVPLGPDAPSDALAGPRTLWESSTGWLARVPGLDAVATYLSQYHRPDAVSSRPRLTSANFCDLVTLPRRLPDEAPFAYFDGPRGDVQPFSPYIADVGHSCVIGGTGNGKSVFFGHIALAARSVGHEVTLFDQHQGFTRMARFAGGTTRTVTPGAPLDNPFHQALTPSLRAWWCLFLQSVVPGLSRTVAALAIDSLYALPPEARDVGVLMDICEENDLSTDDLTPWYDGEQQAVFSPDNEILTPNALEHFDLTAVYDQPVILSYLTSRLLQQLGRGRRRLLIFDEAWAAFASPHLRAFLDASLRTARKLGGALLFASQRPADFAAWAEHLTTRVFLPNPSLTLDQASQIAPVDEAFVEAVRHATPKRDYLVSRGTAWTSLRLDLSPTPHLLALHQPEHGGPIALSAH